MKKTIKRMVEELVEVCDRCEKHEAKHLFKYKNSRNGPVNSSDIQVDVKLHLCDGCLDIIMRSLKRRKRKPDERKTAIEV